MDNKKRLLIYLTFVFFTIFSLILIVKISKKDVPSIVLRSPGASEVVKQRKVKFSWDVDYKRQITLFSHVFLGNSKESMQEIYSGIDNNFEKVLEPGTYHWKVQSKFGNKLIESSIATFTIINNFPILEDVKASVDKNVVNFEWNAKDPDNDALAYSLFLYDSSNNVNKIDLKNNFYRLNLPAGRYSWKIVCFDEFGGMAESKLNYFEIKSEEEKVDFIPTFDIAKKKDGFLISFKRLDGYKYYLQVLSDKEKEIKLDKDFYLLTDIKEGVRYKVRLKVENESGKRFYSPYKEIFVESRDNVPPNFEVLFPRNGFSGISDKVVFRWNIKDDKAEPSVTLYLGTEKNKLKKIVSNYKAKSYEYKGLLPDTTYFWKLVVSDGVNSVESPIFEFKTGPLVEIIDVIGTENDDYVNDVLQTNDDIYILMTSGENVVLRDVSGKYNLDLNIKGEGVDVEEKDGVFYILANTKDGDYILSALKNGIFLFKKRYGGKYKDTAKKLMLSDDGIYILGDTWSDDFVHLYGWNDVFLQKLDYNGKVIWTRNYGGSKFDEAVSFAKISNGYVIVGNTMSKDMDIPKNYGMKDIFVMYLDKNFTPKVTRVFGSKNNDTVSALNVTDGFVYVVSKVYFNKDGETEDANIYYLKLNEDGVRLGEKLLGGSGNDICNDIKIYKDNVYLFGSTNSRDGDFYTYYTAKGFGDLFISNLGKWTIVNGGYEEDEIKYGLITKNGIIFIGNTSSQSGLFDKHIGNVDVFIGKIER
ncbi:fibronectin type III domain-containing protein [Thermosipho globiformans]|uniref:fibronectin type III domain-containing protein n=1 Tax=Thermosipho globiformans TaxID=380685 RepID=UPI001F497644|nr:fibronectin type III domain-containing protein [Thermosipho globiformans]